MADEESAGPAGPEPVLNGGVPSPLPDPPEDAATAGEPSADVPEPVGEAEVEPGVETDMEVAVEAAPAEPQLAETIEPAPDPEPAAEEAAAADEVEEAAVADPAADLDADRIDLVLLEVERLNVRVEELSRLSSRHMEHIDRLHAENQQLRAGELRQAVAPVLRALVRHHDNVAKMAEAAGDEGPEADSLRIVRSGLLNVLSMAGVEAFDVAPKERFDPTRHQGVSRAETDDAGLDGTVAQMRRCGFVADDGRVIRPAEVDVYRLR